MTAEVDTVDAGESLEDEPVEEPSKWGGPGLTWSGDGALMAGRAPVRSPLDVEFEIYPPIIEQGDEGFALASFNRRWVGFLVDQLVIFSCALLISILSGVLDDADAAATAQWAVIVTLVRIGFGLIFNPRGWSPGKLVVGLRIVNIEGDPPGLRWGIMRTAGAVISETALYVGYLWAFFDTKKQTWHDKIAKTYVVRVEESERKTSPGWRR